MGQNKKGPTMSYSLLRESVHTEYGISLTQHWVPLSIDY